MRVKLRTAKRGRKREEEEGIMDVGGFGWTTITIVGVAVLAIVLLVVTLRNKGQQKGLDRTEEATRELYRKEDAARDPMDDGIV
jgi:hypothetical protein